MADEPSHGLAIALPRPVDRRLHLGPFPSARDALKFAGVAAGGLLVVPFAGPVALVPFAAAGFVLARHRSHGRSLDDRILGYAAYHWRRRHGSRPQRPGVAGSGTARTVHLEGGRLGAVIVGDGVPVSFLPPEDARALFESTRRWLDAAGESAYVVADTVAIPAADFRPTLPAPASPDRAAAVGYDEVVRLLLRHRRSRRVTVVLWEPATREGAERLDGRVAATTEALAALGVTAERLAGAALLAAVDRLDLRARGPAG